MNDLVSTNKRLISLDVFRGATMAAMIMVNDPGSWDVIYTQLAHAEWEGCTFTDLIFPFFLFIVGVSIPIVFTRAMVKGGNKKELLIKTLKRGLLIFAIGVLLNYPPDFELVNIRIPGVLQRISIVYVVCAFIFLYASRRMQYAWFAVILLGYYLLMNFVPVPGIGPATLELEHNFAAWFDRLILNGHLSWDGRGTYDITGIFTSIPAIPSGLAGVLAGRLLIDSRSDDKTKVIRLLIAGNALMLAGWAFGYYFPIIRNVWSSSYTVYTSGIALICFAALYWFVDVLQFNKRLAFFIAFGRNALIAYAGSTLFSDLTQETGFKQWMFNDVLSTFLNSYNASLLYSLLSLGLISIPVWWMYKRKIVIKV